MAAKLTLDLNAMQEDFFADAVIIGIRSALPGYRFCWLMNKLLHTHFVRDPEFDIKMERPGGEDVFFEVYEFVLPQNSGKHIIYKLKTQEVHLMPEIKNLDFIWLVQTAMADKDAKTILEHCRNINEIEMAQILPLHQLKNKQHLLI
jgi:hypothetical protein